MATRFDTRPQKQPTAPRAYRCQCGRPVFFRNSRCLACGTPLGYEPLRAQVLPLQPGRADGVWQVFGAGVRAPQYRHCGNFDSVAGCNWLVRLDKKGLGPAMCIACSLNRTIPDLSLADNGELWRRIEGAKRRMVSQLIALGLPVASKVTEDPQHGLAFDFLRAEPGQRVMTGHDDGIITLNIEEADDVKREQIRAQMHEPYRTLLGHFRHEVGHYFWDRLVRDTAWLAHFRTLFGDENLDYAAALKANYEVGPPADWRLRYVSSYASSHPWEDWAETWAHYLHMVDTVDTALSFGIDAESVELQVEPWTRDALWRPDDAGAEGFLVFVNEWMELTAVLNEMSRSMGQHDFYPFVLPRPLVAKLQFIHLVITQSPQAGGAVSLPGSTNAGSEPDGANAAAPAPDVLPMEPADPVGPAPLPPLPDPAPMNPPPLAPLPQPALPEPMSSAPLADDPQQFTPETTSSAP